MEQKPFEISEEDFRKVVIDYLLYEQNVDAGEYSNNVLNKVMYSSDITSTDNSVIISMAKENSTSED